VYEEKTREILLLSGENMAIWQSSSTMFRLRQNLERLEKKNRPAARENIGQTRSRFRVGPTSAGAV